MQIMNGNSVLLFVGWPHIDFQAAKSQNLDSAVIDSFPVCKASLPKWQLIVLKRRTADMSGNELGSSSKLTFFAPLYHSTVGWSRLRLSMRKGQA